MKLSYKSVTSLFFLAYLIPIAALWFLISTRIEQRQTALQLFLQNQIEVDRQILDIRSVLLEIGVLARSGVLKENLAENGLVLKPTLEKFMGRFRNFWKRYETTYTAEQRPFLKDILYRSSELGLVDEEAEVVREILRKMDEYFGMILANPQIVGERRTDRTDNLKFIDALDGKRQDIFREINALADVRFIFAQRVTFFISGENERQYGFFLAVFIGLFSAIFIVSVMEYFFIHKPFKDIMAFLRDMSQGKRGQRLYFSSPIREIKESEEIINQFVNKAEEHEKEK